MHQHLAPTLSMILRRLGKRSLDQKNTNQLSRLIRADYAATPDLFRTQPDKLQDFLVPLQVLIWCELEGRGGSNVMLF